MRFLFVDRILHSSKGEWIQGLKHITAEDYYLSQNDNDKPHFVTSLIGETLGQLAAWNVMDALDFTKRPVAGVVSSVVVNRPAYIGETLLLESFIDSLDESAVHYHSIARVDDEVVFSIDGALGPLLPMANFIEAHEIRRQFAEINRPGPWPKRLPQGVNPCWDTETLHRVNLTNFTFDFIVDNKPGIQLSAVKSITRAAPYFPDHFPNNPVLPMTVLLECKLNLAKEFFKRAPFKHHYSVYEMRRIKMNEFIHPGDVVTTVLSVKKQDENELVLSFRSEVDAKRVCVMELVCKNKINIKP